MAEEPSNEKFKSAAGSNHLDEVETPSNQEPLGPLLLPVLGILSDNPRDTLKTKNSNYRPRPSVTGLFEGPAIPSPSVVVISGEAEQGSQFASSEAWDSNRPSEAIFGGTMMPDLGNLVCVPEATLTT
jgi:hypothetical protein